jgi:hypothetical protein
MAERGREGRSGTAQQGGRGGTYPCLSTHSLLRSQHLPFPPLALSPLLPSSLPSLPLSARGASFFPLLTGERFFWQQSSGSWLQVEGD